MKVSSGSGSAFPNAVVWNPWVDKSKAMGDFGDDEYKVWMKGAAGGIEEIGVQIEEPFSILALETLCRKCENHISGMMLMDADAYELVLRQRSKAPGLVPAPWKQAMVGITRSGAGAAPGGGGSSGSENGTGGHGRGRGRGEALASTHLQGASIDVD